MKKIKLLTVVGTRPEIIRLSSTIKAFDKFFDHVLIHTGQNYDYELNQIFFEDLNIRKPDLFFNVSKSNPFNAIGDLLKNTSSFLSENQVDAFFVLGDTNSALSAYVAKRFKIPVFHYEAGNRCFDDRLPEELNRRIVDHIADINITYSDISREFLIKEGKPSDSVIALGSPMYEVIENNFKNIDKSNILKVLNLDEKLDYFLFSVHREDCVDNKENLEKVMNILESIITKYNKQIIFPMHPRTKNKLKSFGIKINNPLINIINPTGYFDYLKLQKNAKVVLSDSGTISEESSILGFQAINLRDNHERHESMQHGSVMFTGLDKLRILQGLEVLNSSTQDINDISDWYKRRDISTKLVKIILSHINKVNREVWKKNQ
tara:strand:- start:736 stop:1866 length:1131 start_codon:yes stop_codon:yes gene_type:complete